MSSESDVERSIRRVGWTLGVSVLAYTALIASGLWDGMTGSNDSDSAEGRPKTPTAGAVTTTTGESPNVTTESDIEIDCSLVELTDLDPTAEALAATSFGNNNPVQGVVAHCPEGSFSSTGENAKINRMEAYRLCRLLMPNWPITEPETDEFVAGCQ